MTGNAPNPFPAMKPAARSGFSACRMRVSSITCEAPSTPITTNQTSMTGPNRRATASVPDRCTQNSAITITSVTGTTQSAEPGTTSSIPSIADITDMAGVMIASPKNSETPTIPVRYSHQARLPPSAPCALATSDSVPPSPLLSARRIRKTYFTVTISTTVQNSMDTMPITAVSAM